MTAAISHKHPYRIRRRYSRERACEIFHQRRVPNRSCTHFRIFGWDRIGSSGHTPLAAEKRSRGPAWRSWSRPARIMRCRRPPRGFGCQQTDFIFYAEKCSKFRVTLCYTEVLRIQNSQIFAKKGPTRSRRVKAALRNSRRRQPTGSRCSSQK